MGCDIHFRVEFFAQEETVIPDGRGSVEVDTLGEWNWRPAERLTPNPYFGAYSGEPALTVAYEDRFYTGRNYSLFYKLSGVRDGENIEPMSDGNGLPDDMSPEAFAELDPADLDLHSHTHYTLTELLEVDWDAFDTEHHAAFAGTVAQMHVVAIEKCGGNTDWVRAVFAYDN